MAGQAWNARALQQTTTGALPVQKLQLLQQSVTKACGGADGLLDDPHQCSFDPAALRCTAAIANSCLTESEIEAVRRMYRGPRTSTGVQLYPGLSPGGEARWERLWGDPKRLGGMAGLLSVHGLPKSRVGALYDGFRPRSGSGKRETS